MNRLPIPRLDSDPTFRVRRARASDRPALDSLGHPPGAVYAIAPTPIGRLAWRTRGVRVVGLVAEAPDGTILGSIQFVGTRREPGTWMFGHWRVSSARRGRGIGGLLVRQGVRALPGIARLCSLVEWGNERSIEAHRRLGFEPAIELWGRAPLGPLTTLGPPAPALTFEPVSRSGTRDLAPSLRRAMGPLWCSLFPARAGLGDPSPAVAPWDPLVEPGRVGRPARHRYWVARSGSRTDAVLLAAGRSMILFIDPDSSEPHVVARLAQAMVALGCDRSLEIEMRGVTGALVERSGFLTAQILMGLTDLSSLRRSAG